jgi:hypothetical protein
MGQNLPLCGQLGAARSRQDESNEVHEAGRIRRSSGGKGGACRFAVPPDMAVVVAPVHAFTPPPRSALPRVLSRLWLLTKIHTLHCGARCFS